MKKILILGAQGRLGQELLYSLEEKFEVIPLSRFNVDLKNFEETQLLLSQMEFDCIINTAAVCETPKNLNTKQEQEIFKINTAAAINIATYAQEAGILLIHISCALVLAGSKEKSEQALRKPVDIIGQSKAEAETHIEELYKNSKSPLYILRLGLLFGNYGHSLVNNILRLLKKNKKIQSVNDVYYSLSSTSLAASEIGKILALKSHEKGVTLKHICYNGKANPTDIAKYLAELQNKSVEIKSISIKDTEEKPADYSLTSTEDYGDWKEGLSKFLSLSSRTKRSEDPGSVN
ncbi:sugar nucleotide-binding protein [Candidatus Peregrinibacteria bacterium]|jgi:dTDP-4-dehydrorhamnose reductase|nr:sugar nucleotide-binding protein [Candidatus Peregrinibacteria bacterium]